MTNADRLKNMLKTKEGGKLFLDWFSNEMTQTIIGAARERAKPKSPTRPIDSASVLFEHGFCVGANSIVDFMSSPLGAKDDSEGSREPIPDYGASHLMELV